MKTTENNRLLTTLFFSLLFLGTVSVVPLHAQNQEENGEQEQNGENGDEIRLENEEGATDEVPVQEEFDRREIGQTGQMIQPTWENEPLENVVNELAELAEITVELGEDVDPGTPINFSTPAPLYWRDVLDRVLERNELMANRAGPGHLIVTRPTRIPLMEIRDSKLTSIVHSIAQQAGVSIIVSPAVAEQDVEIPQMTLRDVPWQTALDTVVKTAGFEYVREDYGVIRVITAEELRGQLETRTFQLRYLRPPSQHSGQIETQYLEEEDTDEESMTEGTGGRFGWSLLNVISTAMTTRDGNLIGGLQYDERRNILVVTDTPTVLGRIENMLELLDTEPPQVMVQVRFISTTNQHLRDLGMEFSPGMGGSIAPGAPDDIDTSFFRTGEDVSSGGGSAITGGPFGLGGGAAGQSASFRPYLSEFSAQWILRMFEQDEKTRTVQSPRLTVLDGHEATVFVGDTRRFGTITTDRAAVDAGTAIVGETIEESEFSPINEGFQLFVVPHVVQGTDRILLTVVPKNEVITAEEQLEGQTASVTFPTVTTSTVVTRLLLKSGTTAVLSGLIQHDDTARERKIPFIGDLPLLGNLFSAEGVQQQERHDFFFITTYIMPSVEDERQRVMDRLRQREGDLEDQFEDLQSPNGQSLEERLRERERQTEEEFEQIRESGEE